MAENTAKQIVFIVTLLGVFISLVMIMPSGFYVIAPDYEETTYDDYWSADDIKATVNATSLNCSAYVAGEGSPYEFSVDGIMDTIYVRLMWYTFESDNFRFQHHTWGWFNLGVGNIEPFPITKTEIMADVDITLNYSRQRMTCDHHNYIVYFANPGNYSTLQAALNDNIVTVSIGAAFDYEQSVLSGADILTRLLLFQLPNVTTEMNFIIGLPIYTLIGVLAFIIITMVVDMFPLT